MERNRDLIDGNANRRNSLRSTLGEEADALFHRAHAHTSIESSVRGTRVPIRYSSFDRVEALPRDVENAALQIPPSPPVKLDGTRGACSTSRISPPPTTSSITAGSSSRRRLGRYHGCFQRLGRRWIRLTSLRGSKISRYTVALITVIYPRVSNYRRLLLVDTYPGGTKPRSSCPKSLTQPV